MNNYDGIEDMAREMEQDDRQEAAMEQAKQFIRRRAQIDWEEAQCEAISISQYVVKRELFLAADLLRRMIHMCNCLPGSINDDALAAINELQYQVSK